MVLIIVLLVAIVGFVLYYLYHSRKSDETTDTSTVEGGTGAKGANNANGVSTRSMDTHISNHPSQNRGTYCFTSGRVASWFERFKFKSPCVKAVPKDKGEGTASSK
jgi:hypothetical protein